MVDVKLKGSRTPATTTALCKPFLLLLYVEKEEDLPATVEDVDEEGRSAFRINLDVVNELDKRRLEENDIFVSCERYENV
jgi:hypothetical protein